MKKGNLFKSDFLFPDTSFIIGMGSVLNIAGNYYEFESSKSELAADLKALRSDWGVIGQDLKKAAQEVRESNVGATLTLETCQ